MVEVQHQFHLVVKVAVELAETQQLMQHQELTLPVVEGEAQQESVEMEL